MGPKTNILYCDIHTIDSRKQSKFQIHKSFGKLPILRKEWKQSQWNRVQKVLQTLMPWQESKSTKPWNAPRHPEYHIYLITNLFINVSIPYVNLTEKIVATVPFVSSYDLMDSSIKITPSQPHSYYSSWIYPRIKT